MSVLETERLVLRRFTADDAAFTLRLINEPAFHRFVGDRGIRTVEGARDYVLKGPIAAYEEHGFGGYVVTLKADGTPIGLCGLVRREELDSPDLGFAFLSEHWGHGYALESARAVLEFERVERVLAIVTPEHERSISLLKKLGFELEGSIKLTDDADELSLYALEVR